MKNNHKAIIAIFIMLALASTVFATETLNYVYSSTSGSILNENDTQGLAAVNVTLPNTTWNIQLVSDDNKFKVTMPTVTHDSAPDLYLSATPITLSNNDYTGAQFSESGASRYIAKYGYAFNLSPTLGKTFGITMDYSAYAPLAAPRIIKCDFNYSSAKTENTSDCSIITPTTNNNNAQTSVTSFSAFYIAEDRCSDGTKNYDETGVDCGGSSCPACSSGSSNVGGGGSGGGGGGGGGSAHVVYVTPTVVGSTIQVWNGDEVIVLYNDKEYHFRVTKASSYTVTLRSLSNYLTYDISIGDDMRIGLESYLSDDVRISMHITNNFAMLTWKTVQRQPFAFPLLPPAVTRPRRPSQPVVETPKYVPPSVPVSAPPTTGEPTATTSVTPTIAVPESPINLMTIILSLVFVALLIGGFVFYRARLHTDKPPTVTRTGEQHLGTTSEAAKPAPLGGAMALSDMHPARMQGMVASAAAKVRTAEQKVAELVKPKDEPVAYHVPKAKMLEVQRFIYHAYSLGYNQQQVRQKLLEHGWPAELIDEVLENTKLAK